MTPPVAGRWYESRALDHGITLIDECHIRAGARSNIYLVRGRDRDLLVDSGTGPQGRNCSRMMRRSRLCSGSNSRRSETPASSQTSTRATSRTSV